MSNLFKYLIFCYLPILAMLFTSCSGKPKNEDEAYVMAKECVADFIKALWLGNEAKGNALCVYVPIGNHKTTAYSLAKSRNARIDPASFKIENSYQGGVTNGSSSIVVIGTYNNRTIYFVVQFYNRFDHPHYEDNEPKLIIEDKPRILSTMGLYSFDNSAFKAQYGFKIDCSEDNDGEYYTIYNDDMAPYLLQESIIPKSKIIKDFLTKRNDGTTIISASPGSYCSGCGLVDLLYETEFGFECSDDSVHWVNYLGEVDERPAFPLKGDSRDI